VSYVDDFKVINKKRKIYSALFLTLWVPAMVLGELYDPDPHIITLSLKGIGLVFIILAVIKYKCPKCNKTPSWGWHVESCKSCGEPLA